MTIFANNLRRIFGKPVNIILMVVIPILLNVFFISMTTQSEKYTIGMIDNDQSKLTKIVKEQLGSQAKIVDIQDDETVIRAELLDSKIDLAMKIDKGYTDKVIQGKDAKIQTYSITSSNQSEPIRILTESLTSSAAELGRQAAGDSQKFYDAMKKYVNGDFSAKYESFSFTSQEIANRAVTSLGYLAMGMMFLMSFATALLLEDREMGVFSRIVTTPVSRASYMFQHLLSYIAVAVVQIVLIFNIIPQVVDISFGNTSTVEVETMIVTLCFAGVCIAIGLTISRFAKSSAMVGALVSLINFPVLMLGGCLWPKEIMPETVQRIGDFMPSSWFLNAARTVLNGEGLAAAGKNIAAMIGLIAVLLIISFVVRTDEK